ncbi:uL15 family ribosomal protein [Candidatus Woesearchaeota archaeon]|nr:50S ribosomal protein L15P, large subunit ribosomal protein L15 [uncultured archaeon]MBS3096325.1 uL15 family ribosomal protein [Candidatus Woesearchaeota archaeon]
MTFNKRKKNTRQRGHMTHGWGAKKKHRGKGHQGGAGMAGTGKRADSKKPSIWKDKHYFGKFGFVSKTPKVKINAVNISYIEQHINKFLSGNLIKKEDGFYSLELEKLGFNKLLGDGRISTKFRIKAPYASKSAVEKVKRAGGEVTGLAEAQ